MKTLSIAIVSCSKFSSRLVNILSNNDTTLMDYDFKVYSREPTSFSFNYSYDELTRERWLSCLSIIYQSLKDNMQLLGQSDSFPLPEIFPDSQPMEQLPQWMLPRRLTLGDLSVISKHLRAVNDFLITSEDYLLIMEDDVILAPQAISQLNRLIQEHIFDFIDIAGGDGLKVHEHHLSLLDTFYLEEKTNCATRTACAYILSRNSASVVSTTLSSPVMPIDWSLSVALHSRNQRMGVYWLDGDIMVHGSSVGLVKSWRQS
ncbi:hypothetical protein PMIT1318_01863 [Prochlorococcus marinus str. MIT 1318]|uniref:hypothetical protein n=1 Tax=Prochlorococcus TaxID=1218 RepID=UPI0007BAF47B|nr:hypothetical protein [Prochlorococcus marinus]KZR70723.1 hypothetical protein PMIT1318_01863 [Prochlorococcus marinus str. MIT 1318]